jgi:hypothetical protein
LVKTYDDKSSPGERRRWWLRCRVVGDLGERVLEGLKLCERVFFCVRRDEGQELTREAGGEGREEKKVVGFTHLRSPSCQGQVNPRQQQVQHPLSIAQSPSSAQFIRVLTRTGRPSCWLSPLSTHEYSHPSSVRWHFQTRAEQCAKSHKIIHIILQRQISEPDAPRFPRTATAAVRPCTRMRSRMICASKGHRTRNTTCTSTAPRPNNLKGFHAARTASRAPRSRG